MLCSSQDTQLHVTGITRDTAPASMLPSSCPDAPQFLPGCSPGSWPGCSSAPAWLLPQLLPRFSRISWPYAPQFLPLCSPSPSNPECSFPLARPPSRPRPFGAQAGTELAFSSQPEQLPLVPRLPALPAGNTGLAGRGGGAHHEAATQGAKGSQGPPRRSACLSVAGCARCPRCHAWGLAGGRHPGHGRWRAPPHRSCLPVPAGGRLWRAPEVDLLVHARIANRRPEREAAEPSSGRSTDPPGGDFLSRGCAAALQVGVKMQIRSRGLSHGRSFLTAPRACLQATEPRTPRPLRTPRPPHRRGPERAGPDRQRPRILRPLNRSAGVGVLSPRHPSKNRERERHAFPHPLPCDPGWRSLLQQLGLEFGLRKGLHPRGAHAMDVGAGRVSALSSPGPRLFPGAAQEAGPSGQTSPCSGAGQCPQPAGLEARVLADGQALTTLSSLGAYW
ncbi:uncharacterized protein [Symphalangus syndactylus]|uniref:uncharacterized protein n=1 Tax=Symphalangus syndactylus TaxID=9590 RepID=UPI003004A494